MQYLLLPDISEGEISATNYIFTLGVFCNSASFFFPPPPPARSLYVIQWTEEDLRTFPLPVLDLNEVCTR